MQYAREFKGGDPERNKEPSGEKINKLFSKFCKNSYAGNKTSTYDSTGEKEKSSNLLVHTLSEDEIKGEEKRSPSPSIQSKEKIDTEMYGSPPVVRIRGSIQRSQNVYPAHLNTTVNFHNYWMAHHNFSGEVVKP